MLRLSQAATEPGFVQDPYPFYDRARVGGDLFFWEEYGLVCATSHRAVAALLRDRRMGREAPPEVARPIVEDLAATRGFQVDVGHFAVFGRCRGCADSAG